MCWANESWTGIWHGAANRILIEQTYPGISDHKNHFESLLPAFKDPRYLTVSGKPLFGIYRPFNIPEYEKVIDLWREMAFKSGLKGLHIVGMQPPPTGVNIKCIDALVVPRLPRIRYDSWISRRNPIAHLRKKILDLFKMPTVYSYKKICLDILSYNVPNALVYPCLIPNWDNTPRSGMNGRVLHGSTPELFRKQIKKAKEITKEIPYSERIIFIKSWNEWAEGNHLEPDLLYDATAKREDPTNSLNH